MITVEPPSKAIAKGALARFAGRARAAAGLRGGVDVLLTDDATIRGLNRSFRGKDKATDVLSFPAYENAGKHVGDLAISLETAARQAAEHEHSLSDEVRVLMLHGLLHLAGFDHERDKGEMAAREAELRGELGLPVGLIARVAAEGRKATADSSAALRNDRKKSKSESNSNSKSNSKSKSKSNSKSKSKSKNKSKSKGKGKGKGKSKGKSARVTVSKTAAKKSARRAVRA